MTERSLLDTIAAGELDDHLTALAQAVEARRALLYTIRSAGALAALCPGDLVRFTHAISPRYLAGRHATVVDVDVDGSSATVRLDQPVGRFADGHVRCPPLALERLGR